MNEMGSSTAFNADCQISVRPDVSLDHLTDGHTILGVRKIGEEAKCTGTCEFCQELAVNIQEEVYAATLVIWSPEEKTGRLSWRYGELPVV